MTQFEAPENNEAEAFQPETLEAQTDNSVNDLMSSIQMKLEGIQA